MTMSPWRCARSTPANGSLEASRCAEPIPARPQGGAARSRRGDGAEIRLADRPADRDDRGRRACPQPQSRDRARAASRTISTSPRADPRACPTRRPAFQGYRRADGRVGTRNEIWILPTVGCVARTAEKIAEHRRMPAMPGASTASTPSSIRSAARSSATTLPARAAPRRARQPSQCRRRADRRAGLRIQPARRRCWPRSRSLRGQCPHARRAGGAGRDRGGPGAGRRAGRDRRAARRARRRRFPSSCSASNAAARTAFPASPPIRWSGGSRDARDRQRAARRS